jgi:hypothetical protein
LCLVSLMGSAFAYCLLAKRWVILPLPSCRATNCLYMRRVGDTLTRLTRARPSLSPPIATCGDILTSSHVRDNDYVISTNHLKTKLVFLLKSMLCISIFSLIEISEGKQTCHKRHKSNHLSPYHSFPNLREGEVQKL